MFMPLVCLIEMHQAYTYISAWASALLVLAMSGNAKASWRGTSNKYRLPRFFVYVPYEIDLNSRFGEAAGKTLKP